MNYAELRRLLGQESAEALVSTYGGESIRVPARSSMRSYQRKQAILRDFQTGAGYREVAARRRISLSWAYRLYRRYVSGRLELGDNPATWKNRDRNVDHSA